MDKPEKNFISLIAENELVAEGLKTVQFGEEPLLIIHHQGKLHIISNKCGHFGVPLHTGKIKDGAIYCREHGIGFDLNSGKVVNRPWENCDPIQIYLADIEDGMIGILVDS
jgi:nitrite reductase/ring-hydroxylating ferredoxin subunit